MKNILTGILSLIFGLVLCYVAQMEWKRKSSLYGHWEEVSTKVEENVFEQNMYYPVLSFSYKGQNYRVKESSGGAKPALYEPGEELAVLVNPANPNETEIKNFFNIYGKPIILAAFGALALMFSVRIFRGKTSK
jgi:hypothetical protein